MEQQLHLLLQSIEQRHSKVIDLSLDRVIEVKQKLKLNPKFKIITVAGTNGKGSVCNMLNQFIHNTTNLKVGLYTSPHFFRFNERIKIGNIECSDKDLIDAIDNVMAYDSRNSLTFFEITTLVAVYLFDRNEIDLAILEVGLGGRLDAVNAFDSDLSIITSIDIDHTEYLGESIDEIAFEKSGIMRSLKPCVVGEDKNINMIQEQGDLKRTKLYFYKKDFDEESFISKKELLNYDASQIEKKNFACALFAIKKLLSTDVLKFKDAISCLIKQDFYGRFYRYSTQPEIILDVAHNKASLKNLINSINHLPNKNLHFVFSILKDKKFNSLIHLFNELKIKPKWYISELNNIRTESLKNISATLKEHGYTFDSSKSIKQAYQNAFSAAENDDRIIAFGSFYVISEIFKDSHGK